MDQNGIDRFKAAVLLLAATGLIAVLTSHFAGRAGCKNGHRWLKWWLVRLSNFAAFSTSSCSRPILWRLFWMAGSPRADAEGRHEFNAGNTNILLRLNVKFKIFPNIS